MRIINSSLIYSMTYYFMVPMLCGFFVLPGVSYAEESKPFQKVGVSGGSGNSSGAGTVTPDLFTGTMSYSIPIEVPEGRKGMSPGLSLDYRSSNGNGWVGMGWELEVGAIERSMKGGVNYSGDDYVLRFAGGTMDLVQSATNEYRAKIEGAFMRVKKYPGGGEYGKDYWEVADKSGMRYRYGYYAATRQDDPAGQPTDSNLRIFKWCLDKVEDTNGNFMTFTYNKTPFNTPYVGQLYLDKIDYAGHTNGLQTANYVKFYLDPNTRTDAPDMYSTNFRVKTAYRLKTITVEGNGNLIRAYKLTYQYGPDTSRSVLASVQQFGKNASFSDWTVTGGDAFPNVGTLYCGTLVHRVLLA